MKFPGAHILSVGQFERDDILEVFAVADRMEPYAQRQKLTKVLDGAILGSMFFEPSTRTRVSFGCAFNLLGGEVRKWFLPRTVLRWVIRIAKSKSAPCLAVFM